MHVKTFRAELVQEVEHLSSRHPRPLVPKNCATMFFHKQSELLGRCNTEPRKLIQQFFGLEVTIVVPAMEQTPYYFS